MIKKITKLIIAFIGIISILIVFSTLFLSQAIKSQDYKDKIISIIKNKLGYEIIIKGKMDYFLFPSPGLEAKNIEVKNYADISSIKISIEPIPLFIGKVKIKKIIAKNSQFKIIPIAMRSLIEIDLVKKTASLHNIDAQYKNSHIGGDIKIEKNLDSKDLYLQGKLTIDHLNFGTIKIKNIAISFQEKVRKEKSAGTIKISSINWDKIHLENIYANFKGKGDSFYFDPVLADIYQGKLRGKVKLTNQPYEGINRIKSSLFLSDIETKPFLIDATRIDSLKGKASININFETMGETEEIILLNLNGHGDFYIKDGAFFNVDVPYQIEALKALLEKKPTSQPKNNNQTQFQKCEGTFEIKNGVFSNNDLFMISPYFKIKGQGKADIIKQKIDYKMNAEDIEEKLGFAIPIKIIGPFSRLNIYVDKSNANFKILEKKAKQKLDNLIKKYIPSDTEKNKILKVVESIDIDKILQGIIKK